MNNLSDLTISRAKELLLNRSISSVELTKFFFEKISSHKNLNCFITETFDQALRMSKKSDEKYNSGKQN